MKTIYKKIEAIPKDNCLVVHYDIVDNFQPNNCKQSLKQIINISKPANKNVDFQKIAKKILQKCDIIPRLRYYEVMSALVELNKNGSLSTTQYYEFPFLMQNLSSNYLHFEILDNVDISDVSIEQIDYYIELLYEELEEKIKAALCILNLVNKPENLNLLFKNDTLLCALSRVLREDGKKSLELAIYIICIFCYFSNYVDFHHAIINYKVGSTCLELIYFEILREESWHKELNQKKSLAESQLDNLNAKLAYEKLLVSYQSLVKKQNLYFRYALYVLLNISEDLKLEYKIVQKGIISILVKLLERNSEELLLIIVIYLKKLSVFIQNKIQLKEANFVKNLTPLLYLDNEVLVYNTLKLIYNLIVDKEIRVWFIRTGIITKLVSFFTKGSYISVIVSIFYLICCEPKYIALFKNYPHIIDLLLEKILQNVEYKIVLNNLIVNLSTNYSLAQLIVENNDYSEIVKIAFLQPDIYLLRLCRNISCHGDISFKLSLASYQDKLIELMLESGEKNGPLLVECVAILANLCPIQIDWLTLYKQHNLMEFFSTFFKSNQSVKKFTTLPVRFILLLIANTASKIEICDYLLQNDIINQLLDLINHNQENDDIVLNTVYCLNVLVKNGNRELRHQITTETKLIEYLIELIYDRNYQIKSLCTLTLDIISEEEIELTKKIQNEKFTAYNNKWLSMIQSDRALDESSHSMLEDMFIYPDLFLKMDILNDSSSENFSD